MSSVAKSVYYFSFYLMVSGLALFFASDTILPLLGIPGTTDVWVNVAATLVFILGVFFFHMARKNSRDFFFISLFGRGIFTVSIASLVLFYNAPVPLLLFAAVDVIGFLWTLGVYRKG
jgi:hypothetical protein